MKLTVHPGDIDSQGRKVLRFTSLEWQRLEAIVKAAEGMATALHNIAYDPLTEDMEADSAACLTEATRIARVALAVWEKAGQQ